MDTVYRPITVYKTTYLHQVRATVKDSVTENNVMQFKKTLKSSLTKPTTRPKYQEYNHSLNSQFTIMGSQCDILRMIINVFLYLHKLVIMPYTVIHICAWCGISLQREDRLSLNNLSDKNQKIMYFISLIFSISN